MKKKVASIVLAAVLTMGLIGGCKVEPAQIKVIAQSAGLFAAVGWIAADNPDTEGKKAVASILNVIAEKAGDVKTGSTYTEVIFPELTKVINNQVPKQYRPLAQAGGLSFLGGIDMLFAVNPEWKASQDIAADVVNSFVFGAKNGLALGDDDPIIVQAHDTARRRARVWKN